MPSLLAVDIGLRTGLALYGSDGRLRWCRSHNLGTRAGLKRAAHRLLVEHPQVSWLVLEGGGPIADVWRREADRRGIAVLQISAEAWRERLLYARQQRSGPEAKSHAQALARRVIEWSDVARPSALRHHAAEAILAGLFGVLEVGWLKRLPPELGPCA